MLLQSVSYQNFRNIKEASLSFSPGVNVLMGKNAEGKTNALEGIFLFATGRSHRTVHEREFLLEQSPFAQLSLQFKDARREQTLSLRYLPSPKSSSACRKVCLQNGAPLKRMSELIGHFRAVLFCPEHLALVREGPKQRRNFLDGAISQSDPSYMTALQRYTAVLNQRNHLLPLYFDNRKVFLDTVDIWSEQLSDLAAQIAAKRLSYVKRLSESSALILSDMTGGREKLTLSYKKALSAEEYRKLLSENYEKEAKFGATLYGIHRDDIEIELDGKTARSYASQGQQRSIAVAMKLSEGELSKEKTGEYPVFLLDDILSELDEGRKAYILSGFAGQKEGLDSRQILLTCCDGEESGMTALRGKIGRRFRVEKGSYTPL